MSRYELNKNLAQMLKGGVIMDVTTPEEAIIAEKAGACAVMALERVPSDIRKEGGVARMSDPKMIKEIQGKIPIFGICLGHQLFSLANGAKNYKMKFGHRGFNHAVREIATGRIDFTSQNHGYAVSSENLPEDLMITHVEINDDSVEGLRHKHFPAFSVQFHPDAAPGPHDASYLFDDFMDLMDNFKK